MNAIRLATSADFSTLVLIWENSVRATHDFLNEQNAQAVVSTGIWDFR
jgi:hypothetical protein